MKSGRVSVAASAFLAVASAIPTKRQSGCIVQTVVNPSQNQTMASITQWTNDVNNVNNFLNTVPDIIDDSDTLLSQAQIALTSASDEPCQLMTLATVENLLGPPDARDCAVSDLMDVFDLHVIQNLMIVITNPTDTTAAQAAVDDINAFRCCNVLPDVDILFANSAQAQGIAANVDTTVGREDACNLIGCTPQCPQLAGADGT